MTMAEMRTNSFINGEWVGSSSQIDVLNPATGKSLASVANASIADCLRAVDVAAEAFDAWKNTAPRVRGEILRKAFEIMMAEQEQLARLITLEMGKILADSRAEVAYAAEFFRWFSEEAVRIDGDYRRAPGGANWLMVSRQPVGVALLATPWNFPAAMATRSRYAAYGVGNCRCFATCGRARRRCQRCCHQSVWPRSRSNDGQRQSSQVEFYWFDKGWLDLAGASCAPSN